MEENNTILVSMCDKNAEKDIDLKVTREKMNEIFKRYDFDLSDIDSTTKLPTFLNQILNKDKKLLLKFNTALTEMNKNKEINIFEVVLILSQDWIDEKDLINKILDPINFHALRVEAKKFIGKKRKSKLFDKYGL